MLVLVIAWLFAFSGLKMLVTYRLSTWRSRGRPISIAFFGGIVGIAMLSVKVSQDEVFSPGGGIFALVSGLILGVPCSIYWFCKTVERGYLSGNKEVAMISYLEDEDRDVRRAAVLAFLQYGPRLDRALVLLRKLADSDKDQCIRVVAAEAIRVHESPSSPETLGGQADSSNPEH